MVRRDLSNRDDSGNFKPAYDEPLSDRTIGLRLFGSDQIAIEEAAAEAGVTQTELVREIVRREVVRWDMAGGSGSEALLEAIALLQAERGKIWNELGRERSAAASRSVRGEGDR
jgi:predicted DNA binding CopG/RHH family protein